MIGFYVIRGHDPDRLVNMSETEKSAHYIWMEQHYEEETQRYKAMMGGK
ncbi:hypothetical protein SAMN05444162_3456 [Paenibacillaceae bacterium GAS479]|nr:hypothetical protein SAMN05444162_3456 [Paenibacillaceae bacterium GAS479]